MSLFLNLKKNKVEADLYYKGKKIATIKVNERNIGSRATLSLDCDQELRFKIVKVDEKQEIDETIYNSELYNV